MRLVVIVVFYIDQEIFNAFLLKLAHAYDLLTLPDFHCVLLCQKGLLSLKFLNFLVFDLTLRRHIVTFRQQKLPIDVLLDELLVRFGQETVRMRQA